jgi:phage-related protein
VPLFDALGQVITALVPILTPIIALVGQLAMILGNEIAQLITTVVVPALQAIAALLSGDFSGAWELAKTAVTGALQFMKDLVTKFPGQVVEALKPLAGKLWGLMKEAGKRFLVAAGEWIVNAVAKVRELPGKAKTALGNLGGALKNAGIELIRGFIRGISSMFGSVKSKLGDLTSSLTSWKGPESLDKKILTPAGRMVIGGFMAGIDRSVPALRSQLQGLTGDLPGMAMDVNPQGVFRSATRTDQRLALDVTGSDEDMKRLIRRIVKTQGRGNVQTAFGY